MSRLNYSKLNHSRSLSNGHVVSQYEYETEKSKPTAKQRKFLISLVMQCKEVGVDFKCGKISTRVEYAFAIDSLIKRLKKAGVDIKTNNKKVTAVLNHKPDAQNNDFITTERFEIEDIENE